MSSSTTLPANLPQEPDAAIRLGLRIIEQAYDDKSRALDQELQQLRTYSKQQQSQVAALERRVAELEQHVRDGDERARQLADEKAQLAHDLKTTQRDLSKLDSFKRSILQSINDDDTVAAGGVGAPGGRSVGAEYHLITPGAPPMAAPSAMGRDPGLTAPLSSMHALPPASPAAPPCGTHPFGGGISGGSATTAGAALGGAGVLGAGAAVAGSPAGRAMASPAPQEGAGVAANLDGKDFFRQARLRLTYEQFNQFLTNIKRLNDHAQSREETLQKAQQIFGADNGDLFVSFKALLTKHGLS